jgi:hypothetical protein
MREVYDSLRVQLEIQEWPNVYLFKFIIPNTSQNLAKTSALFSDTAEISINTSRTGKFVSVSVKELMLNVDSIINKYLEAGKIKGLIAL